MGRQRVAVLGTVALVAFLSGGWFLQRGAQREQSVYQRARLFDDVMAHIADYYVDPVSERELYEHAITGMLSELRDPYSVFLAAGELRGLNEATTGNYGGLGIQIDVRDGAVVVIAPLPESPAESVGIHTGDRIVAVDGRATTRWNNEEAVRTLRGPPGTAVVVTVERAGLSAPLTFSLTRGTIHIRSVQFGMLVGERIGYISLNPFSQSSAAELIAEINRLKGQGMRSLMLDLRNNPGGLLEEGIAVADLFLDPGQEIVSTRGRAPGTTQRFADRQPQRYGDLPVAILVNGASASASEIVAGALQDHDRALLVGTPTFGKGQVQTLFRLSSDAGLKLTTARWYTPGGRSIQRPASDEREQERLAERAAEQPDSAPTAPLFRTDRGRPVRGGGGIVPDVLVRPDSQPAADRLERALGSDVPKYLDALAAFALQVKAVRSVTESGFRVGPEMRGAFLATLAQRGVTLAPAVLAEAGPFIDRQIGYQVARYVFGRAAEFRRAMENDRVVSEALRLLARARTPSELIALAGAAPAAPPSRP